MKKAKVTSFSDLNPKQRVENIRFESVIDSAKKISGVTFPFVNSDYDLDRLEDLKESTNILIKNANEYINFLNHLISVNSI